MGGTVRAAVFFRNRRLLGSRRSRTWVPLVVVLGAAAVVAVVAVSGLWSSSSRAASEAQKSTPTAALPTSTTTSPAPADVDAARACAAFNSYLAQASQGRVPRATGEALTNDAYQLLAGASQDQASGQPLPKWTNLGEYLIAAADDVVNKDTSALSKDGTAAADACQTIPESARAAGGYVATSSPSTSTPSNQT
jgi:hypothetical protein